MAAITVSSYTSVAPRGALIAAEVFTRLRRALKVLFAPVPTTPAEDVAEVRALAHALRQEDPRLATELMCAADRYERHYVG